MLRLEECAVIDRTYTSLAMKYDLHTHYYPGSFFEMIRDLSSEFSFDKDPTGRTIIKFRGARFFGITPPMSDPAKRLEDMDRVGIEVEVLSLSTPKPTSNVSSKWG